MYDLQRASMWKRISAWLFDIIMLAVVAVAASLLLSAVLGYDNLSGELEASYDKYEQTYGVDLALTEAQYDALSDTDKARYDAAKKALASDTEIARLYELMMSYTLIIVTFAILISYLLLEFLVPLLLGNGQTLGKKVFGVGVMREDGVRISTLSLFVRTVLGKYTVETMIPVMVVMMIFFGAMGIFGIVVLLILLVSEIALLAMGQGRPAIHDKMARTVCVDLASQMIFESEEAMLEYKKRLHEENVSRTDY